MDVSFVEYLPGPTVGNWSCRSTRHTGGQQIWNGSASAPASQRKNKRKEKLAQDCNYRLLESRQSSDKTRHKQADWCGNKKGALWIIFFFQMSGTVDLDGNMLVCSTGFTVLFLFKGISGSIVCQCLTCSQCEKGRKLGRAAKANLVCPSISVAHFWPKKRAVSGIFIFWVNSDSSPTGNNTNGGLTAWKSFSKLSTSTCYIQREKREYVDCTWGSTVRNEKK